MFGSGGSTNGHSSGCSENSYQDSAHRRWNGFAVPGSGRLPAEDGSKGGLSGALQRTAALVDQTGLVVCDVLGELRAHTEGDGYIHFLTNWNL